MTSAAVSFIQEENLLLIWNKYSQ